MNTTLINKINKAKTIDALYRITDKLRVTADQTNIMEMSLDEDGFMCGDTLDSKITDWVVEHGKVEYTGIQALEIVDAIEDQMEVLVSGETEED